MILSEYYSAQPGSRILVELVVEEVEVEVDVGFTEDWSDQLWSGLVRPAYLLLTD